jgi:TolA-binding protein
VKGLLGIGFALLAASALAQAPADAPAQGRPRGGADAGPNRVRQQRPFLLGTDPPGKLRKADPQPDAGPAAQQDAGPDELHRSLQALQARVDALERDRAQQQQNAQQQLDELVRQVQELRAQIADAEARKQAAEQQQAGQQERVQTAVDSLYQAQQRLAGGNSSIEAELDQAQAAFSGQAQRDVQAARMALQNRDLSAARAYLASAIANARQGR